MDHQDLKDHQDQKELQELEEMDLARLEPQDHLVTADRPDPMVERAQLAFLAVTHME